MINTLSITVGNPSTRLTTLSKGGFGFGQFDISHRTTTFVTRDLILNGKIKINSWNEITFYSPIFKTPNGAFMSIGINPFIRVIKHQGPSFKLGL